MQLAEEHNPLAWVAPILAFVLVAMIWYLLHAILTAREQVINRDVFNVVLGALVTAFTTVMAYYFGSSLGSSKKDEALSSGRLQTNPKIKFWQPLALTFNTTTALIHGLTRTQNNSYLTYQIIFLCLLFDSIVPTQQKNKHKKYVIHFTLFFMFSVFYFNSLMIETIICFHLDVLSIC